MKAIIKSFQIVAFCVATVAIVISMNGCRYKWPAEEPPPVTATTPDPTVELIAGEPTLLGSTAAPQLTSLGYKQTEYFFSGSARSFTSNNMAQSDGKWTVQLGDNADYKTRIVVYQPIDPAKFNGTVIFEWLNVSGGLDAAPDWVLAHTELARKGYIWIGVSAQKAGIDGGGFLGLPLHLKAFNPTRYNVLVHPGDKYGYDIFSQAAQAVLHPTDVDPLSGLEAQRAIAAGESQSADFLVTYYNAIQPGAKLFDGYLIHSRFRGSAGLTPVPLAQGNDNFSTRSSVFLRDDLKAPVLLFQTETDLLQLFAYSDMQPDSSKLRIWEVAGTAHADLYQSEQGATDLGNNPNIAAVVEDPSPNPLTTCDKPVNAGPQHFVLKAAYAALDNWLRNGVAPKSAERLQVDTQTMSFVKDSIGNVKGGVRTNYVDAPIAVLSGEGQTGGTLCGLYGTTQLLSSVQLLSLYPDHATFVAQVNASVDGAIINGFLTPTDGALIKTWAQGAAIP